MGRSWYSKINSKRIWKNILYDLPTSLLESLYKIARKDLPETKFVAKKEPSQTQRGELDIILCDNDSKREVIGTYIRNNVNGKCPNTGIEVSRSQIASKYNSLGISNDNWKLCYIKDNPKLLQVFFVWNTPCRTLGNSAKVLEYDPKNGNYFYNLNNTQTQIAKAEPSQTQKVASYKYPEKPFSLPVIANNGDSYKYLVANLNNRTKFLSQIIQIDELLNSKHYMNARNIMMMTIVVHVWLTQFLYII